MGNVASNIAKLFAAINGRNLPDLGDLCADDVVFRFPKTAPLEGRERVVRFMNVLLRRFPTLQFTVGRIAEGADRGAAEWTNSGADRSGTPYANEGVTFFEFRNGQIVYMSDTFKDTSLF